MLWILGALFLIYFGNGSADLVNLMFRDVRVIGWARAGWAACFLGNVGIYIYVSWILWAVHKREVDYEEVPWSLPVATVLGFGATGFFCIALVSAARVVGPGETVSFARSKESHASRARVPAVARVPHPGLPRLLRALHGDVHGAHALA